MLSFTKIIPASPTSFDTKSLLVVVSIGMTNGESKMASNNAPNGHRWIQLIKLFSQTETSVSQFHREFFTPTRWWHKFQPWEPLKSCETNLPAAVSCSHVFVNWAISVNFWKWVDRTGTGARRWHSLPPVAQNRAFRAFSCHTAVARIDVTWLLFQGLILDNCHTDYVTQTLSRDFSLKSDLKQLLQSW